MNVIRRLSSRVCSCVILVIILPCMAIPVMEFQVCRDTKLERVLPKNRHKEKKFLNFENWCTLDSGINIGVRLLFLKKFGGIFFF